MDDRGAPTSRSTGSPDGAFDASLLHDLLEALGDAAEDPPARDRPGEPIQLNAVGEPAGLRVAREWVPPEREAQLLGEIDKGRWETGLARRVQQYGIQYDYRSRQLRAPAEPLPPLLAELALSVEQDTGCEPLTQAIVNEYLPGQGISAHIDSAVFGPTVASVSLGSNAVMVFRDRANFRSVSVPLPRRSLMVMSGAAREHWTHEIPARRSDRGVPGLSQVRRGRRVSITFRSVR
jgi:alkylated DNA repair dioxygenase AlkB